jgi:hypothetical protein
MSAALRIVCAMTVALPGAGCAVRTAGTEFQQYTVEIAAARTMLQGRRTAAILVDSETYAPDQAPPQTVGVRDPAHQAAIIDEMNTYPRTPGGDTVRLQMSRPLREGRRARICITVVDRYGYQTVRLLFERRGPQWVVIERTRLGVSGT